MEMTIYFLHPLNLSREITTFFIEWVIFLDRQNARLGKAKMPRINAV
jgi:hypothetical protein